MKQHEKSQTDWERVRREIDEDAPIPFDDEDRADGLYDPNNEVEVEEFFRNARITYAGRVVQEAPTKKVVSLQLSQDVLDFYRAKGGDWQAAIDDVLRRSMSA